MYPNLFLTIKEFFIAFRCLKATLLIRVVSAFNSDENKDLLPVNLLKRKDRSQTAKMSPACSYAMA